MIGRRCRKRTPTKSSSVACRSKTAGMPTSTPTETQEQIAFMDWVRLQPNIHPYCIHIANQRRANLAYGRLLKRMGVRAGVSDIFIAMPRNGACGLWIEFKRSKGGVISDEQRTWLCRMLDVGYSAKIAHGCDEAIAIVKTYFGMQQ